MNKPLPPPRLDDLVEDLHALSLASKKPTKLPPCVENLKGLSLVDKKSTYLPPRVQNLSGLSLIEEEPANLSSCIRNLVGLSLNDREPSQKQKKCPPLQPLQGRCDLVENRNARSLAGKKRAEKKLPDLPGPLQATFVSGSASRLSAANTEVEGHRRPLGSLLPNVNQKTLVTPPETTVVASNQIKTSIPVPQDTPTKPALVPQIVIVPLPPQLDSVLSPRAAVKPPVSAGPGPAKSVLDAAPPHPRPIVVPPSPATTSPEKNTIQCSAITRAGNQCLRQFKPPAMYSHLDPTLPLYCYQHKEIMLAAQNGCYVRTIASPDQRFVYFAEYIPKYLQVHTQLALRKEMDKPLSSADGPGYIYAFEIRDPKRQDVIQLKVGRTVNLTRRLYQWDKQCGPKAQNIPCGWWPGAIDGTAESLLKCNINPGDPGPFCHRVERLVHIELSDLTLHAPYLHPSWVGDMSELPPNAASPSRKTGAENKCDCGVVHKEIFTFRRPEGGRYNEKEWNSIVKPVIERWGKFVGNYPT